jgi:hypothetical protein
VQRLRVLWAAIWLRSGGDRAATSRTDAPRPRGLVRRDRADWCAARPLLFAPAMSPPPLRRSFLIRWILACGLGELLGLSAAAVALWANARAGEPESAMEKAVVLLSAIGAGVLEGAITGTLQWLVLRRRYADLRGGAWVGATIAVATLGWAAGMSVPLFLVAPDAGSPPPAEPSLAFIIAFACLFGAIAGALFGGAQAAALAPHVRRVWPWIAGNAVGFALGLPFTYVAGGVLSESPLMIALVGGGSGLAMGLAVALSTAVALRALPPAPRVARASRWKRSTSTRRRLSEASSAPLPRP